MQGIDIDSLRCPCCLSELLIKGQIIKCSKPECGKEFPVINGIPVLINEDNSVFAIYDFISKKDTFFKSSRGIKKTARAISRILPKASLNVTASKNFSEFTNILNITTDKAKVLTIGGSILGQGMELIVSDDRISLYETDVSFGPRAKLICDAHNLPFPNGYFDGVIVQAVLEHVVDPIRCVEEIYRVLKMDGIVYSDTPFMQQVHGRQYDFTRYTRLGHRRLFRNFLEINSGISCGPGVSLASAYRYFLLSFIKSQTMRYVLSIFADLTSFWLKYFDYVLINKPAALDAASGLYFLGKKTDRPLSDKELLRSYKGGM